MYQLNKFHLSKLKYPKLQVHNKILSAKNNPNYFSICPLYQKGWKNAFYKLLLLLELV
jgi:hypothetical protein